MGRIFALELSVQLLHPVKACYTAQYGVMYIAKRTLKKIQYGVAYADCMTLGTDELILGRAMHVQALAATSA